MNWSLLHMSKKIVFIRHGKTNSNIEHRFSGWEEATLSKEGIEELLLFKETLAYPKTDLYYSSDLKRAIDTFNYLFGDEQTLYRIEPGFRETHFGEIDGKTSQEAQGIHMRGEFLKNKSPFGAETVMDFSSRIYMSLSRIYEELTLLDLKSATIVAHSGTLKMLRIILENRPFSDYFSLDMDNGRGYWVEIERDDFHRFKLLNIGDI